MSPVDYMTALLAGVGVAAVYAIIVGFCRGFWRSHQQRLNQEENHARDTEPPTDG